MSEPKKKTLTDSVFMCPKVNFISLGHTMPSKNIKNNNNNKQITSS